jgi:cysteine sulfinate desulfinase/cysteine desulfurase-like protein
MNVDAIEAKCVIRVSLGTDTTLNEIEKFVSVWKDIWNRNQEITKKGKI